MNQTMGEVREDKRLDRLFEYTKFHIGIYLSAGGGLIVLLGSGDKSDFIQDLIGSPKALAVALALMALAGLAGGVIASATTQCRHFEDLWLEPQGPLKRFTRITGRWWARIEHGAFWASAALIAYAVLCSPSVRLWLTAPGARYSS